MSSKMMKLLIYFKILIGDMSVENYTLLRRVTHVCLRPIKINVNGKLMFLPCRKCAACLNNRSSRLARLMQIEAQQREVTLFVTLTYAPEYLPMMYISSAEMVTTCARNERLLYEYRDSKTDEVVTHSIYDKISLLQDKCELDGGLIPYLSKTDLQKFFKRLKYYATKSNIQDSYSYFACGEYGPQHFRPHYHILLHCSRKDLQSFIDALHSSWKFGRIDYSLDRGKTANYISSYTTSFADIPRLYSNKEIRPFFVHTIHYGLTDYIPQTLSIIDNPKAFVTLPFQSSDRTLEIRPWSSFSFAFFPKIPHYRELLGCAPHLLCSLYSLYSSKPETLDMKEYTKHLMSEYLAFNDGLFNCIERQTGITFTEPSVYKTLQVSKRFLTICEKFNISSTYYLQQIQEYYRFYESQTLKDWYTIREQLTSEEQLLCYDDSYDGFIDVDGFYISLDTIDHDYIPELEILYDHLATKYFDQIKHKEQNDANKMFH